MREMQLFKERGYEVLYLWEHDHRAALKKKLPLLPFCRRL